MSARILVSKVDTYERRIELILALPRYRLSFVLSEHLDPNARLAPVYAFVVQGWHARRDEQRWGMTARGAYNPSRAGRPGRWQWHSASAGAFVRDRRWTSNSEAWVDRPFGTPAAIEHYGSMFDWLLEQLPRLAPGEYTVAPDTLPLTPRGRLPSGALRPLYM